MPASALRSMPPSFQVSGPLSDLHPSVRAAQQGRWWRLHLQCQNEEVQQWYHYARNKRSDCVPVLPVLRALMMVINEGYTDKQRVQQCEFKEMYENTMQYDSWLRNPSCVYRKANDGLTTDACHLCQMYANGLKRRYGNGQRTEQVVLLVFMQRAKRLP